MKYIVKKKVYVKSIVKTYVHFFKLKDIHTFFCVKKEKKDIHTLHDGGMVSQGSYGRGSRRWVE